MIYLDTSVVLAQLLVEDRKPPREIWQQPLFSSRLLEYEVWTRLHARGLGESHGEAARAIIARISFAELTRDVLGRAVEPWPVALRTLDALHLATLLFLRGERLELSLATYDVRMQGAAEKLGIPLSWEA